MDKKRIIVFNILCAATAFVLASFGEVVNLITYGWTSRGIPFWAYGLMGVAVVEVAFLVFGIVSSIRKRKK